PCRNTPSGVVISARFLVLHSFSSRLLRNDRDVMIGLLLHLLKFSPVSLDPRSLWDNANPQRLDDFSQINAFDLTVLSTPAHEIVARIGARRLNWNARNVMKAFIKAAIRAHAETNCLDQVNVKGFDSTIGFTKFVNQPAGENAPVVDRLVEEGAIPFTKTNVPQSLFSFECSNPVFGHTHNPHKRGFTCGGRSGGEAALLASDGSCLGIGSDIGGSLRIPAHYSGCYSLKPCSGRIVQDGFRDCDDGLHRDSRGDWANVMLHKPDPTTSRKYGLVPLEDFRYDIFDSLVAEGASPFLKFGFFTSDDLIETSSPCRRAVEETLAGYDCVEIDVSRLDVLEGLILYVGLSSADGYKTGLSHLGRDPTAESHVFKRDDSMFLTTIGCMLPSWLRWIVCGITRYLLQDDVMAKLIEASQEKSTGELQKWRVRKDAYCLEVRSYLWEELGLDGLICPTQAVPAVPIGSSWNKSFLAESTLIWNLVDSTVGHIPITRVDIQRDQIRSDANSMTNAPKRSGDMWRVKDLLPSVEETEGLPVGIQLVCGFLEEEKTLALMGIIVKSWNNRPKQTAPLPKPGDFLGKKQGLGVAKSHP
ncbi:hypothetical protein PSTT_14160, partial [Puccinia striiformis]